MKRVQTDSQSITWVLSVLASRVYLGVFFGLILWAVLPMVIQWQSTVVISGSMEPGVSTGDIVVAQTFTQEEIANGAVKVGDVTLAHSPDKADTLVTHRVTEILENGDFKTKGDANKDTDSTPVPRANVIGVERILVPYVGIPLQTLRAGDPAPTLVFLIVTILAQWIVFKDVQNDRHYAKTVKSKSESPMNKGHKAAARAAALCGVVAAVALTASLVPPASTVGFSQASFSGSNFDGTSSFAAKADWTPPTTTMNQPISPLKETVTLTANAADEKSGIKNLVMQHQMAGTSTWVNVCTVATAPYLCLWNTTTVTDGNYDLRSVATDNAGHSTISASVQSTVANKTLVVLTSPGEYLKGTKLLKTTLYNTGTVNYSVRVEYSLSGANSWKSICTGLASPYDCSWNTATVANGDYDVRSVAVSGSTTYTSASHAVMVDNSAPTVAMTDPSTPISGSWTFAATATDANSGVAKVTIQYAKSGTSTYVDLCAFTETPYSCRIDTTTITNGTYDFRAIADDIVGNRSISAAVSNRVIDNTVSSVSMEDPGAFLIGEVTLTARANSTAGISSVVIQMAPNGNAVWNTLCSFSSAPFVCSWDTKTVVNGAYSFRAILTDSRGAVTTSAIVASRQVDNLPLRGFDVTPANGAGTVGRIDTGDTLAFTYTAQVSLPSVTTGWNGAATPVTVRIQDGGLVGMVSTTDLLDVQRNGSSVKLGSVNLRQDYVKNQKTVVYNATMSSTTVMVNGVSATRISVTLNDIASGRENTLRTVTATANAIWTPSGLVTDLNGKPASTAPVTELGSVDRDF